MVESLSEMNGHQVYPEGTKEQPQQNQKKEQHPFQFFWLFTNTILTSYTTQMSDDLKGTIYRPMFRIAVSAFVVISFTVISCKMAKNKCEVLILWFLLDNIFFAMIVNFVGLLGITVARQEQLQIRIPSVAVSYLNIIIFAGTYRILIANTIWKKWQIILIKLALLAASVSYLITAYQTIFKPAPKKPNGEFFRQFLFLYVFGQFAFLLQIYSKITDIDGTGEMKYHYSVLPKEEQPQEKRINQTSLQNQIINESKIENRHKIAVFSLENQ